MKAATFSVTVTHGNADHAGEVAEAFAKLVVFMGEHYAHHHGYGDAAGASSTLIHSDRSDVQPGWRFDVTVRAATDHEALDLAAMLRLRLADAGEHDGRGCNLAFGSAMLSLIDLPDLASLPCQSNPAVSCKTRDQ